MNRNCYRVIFNAARGLLMVVGEVASSGDRARGASGPRVSKGAAGHALQALGSLKACLLIVVGSTWMLTAQAEIVADPNAPTSVRPVVTETASQTTQVNITAPSSGGVSRNLYRQFDVDSNGVILNNSHQSTQTELAGWIEGNSALQQRRASIILNEVNSSDPSLLQGYIEVAGQRAEVVIANPSGIQVDGAGFINVSNATLTTGRPVMQGGHLDHYRVTGGTIAINGNGLDSTQTDYTQLIARTLDINAGIWANDLSVISGANEVDATSLDATALALNDGSTGTQGASIDVAALGGMYAGKIFLVGTEHGVGIHNHGTLAASSGDVVITEDGQLLNAGTIQAEQGSVDLTADTLTNSGEIAAESALISRVDTLDNTDGALLTNRFDIETETLLNTDGTLQQLGSRTLELTLAAVDNSDGWIGQLEAENDEEQDLDLTVPDDIEPPTGDGTPDAEPTTASDPATTEPPQAGSIQVTGLTDNQGGTISSTGRMDLTAETLDNSQGEVQLNSLTMEGLYLHNADGVIHTQQAELELVEWDNSEGLFEAGDLIAQLDSLRNDDGDIRADNLELDIDSHFRNAGRLEAGDRLVLNTRNLTNQVEGEINAGETNITVDQTLTNRGLIDGEQTYIDAATLTNIGTGRIYGDHVGLQAGQLNNFAETENGETHTGTVAARNWLDIGATRVDNADGSTLMSLGGLSIGGSLDENYQATGAAERVLNRSARIESHGDMFITTDRLVNRDDYLDYEIRELERYSETVNLNKHDYRQYTVRVNGAVITSQKRAEIISGGNLTIDGRDIVNHDSHILAGETLSLVNKQIDNRSTEVAVTITHNGTYRWRERYWRCRGPFGTFCSRKTRWHNDSYSKTFNVTDTLEAYRSESNAQVNLEGAVDARMELDGTAGEAPSLAQLTTSGLFQPLPNTSAGYLIQTDPAFANYNTWLSSDFMLAAMGIGGDSAPLRLGDGFYEQQLITQQIIAQTGQRYLGDFTDNNTQYQNLMTAGVTFAQEQQLRPGIALSSAQVEALTTDIVWLVEQEVTLPDGRVETVLVPKVYAVVREGDLDAHGALLAGRNVNIDIDGEFNNTGTVQATQSVQVNAEEINHEGGDIAGAQVRLSADEDINIIGASVQAEDLLALDAGNDLNVITTTAQGQGTYERTYTNPFAAFNGRPAETTAQIGTIESQIIDQYAGLTVRNGNGEIIARAGNDINLTGAEVDSAGDIHMEAGNDLNLSTVTESSSDSISTRRTDIANESRRDAGTQITGGGNITMLAGNDFRATAADVQAGKSLMIEAEEGNVEILAGVDYSSSAKETSYSNGLFGPSGSNSSEQRSQQAIGSSFSAGGDFVIQAGEQVTIQASDLSASDTLLVSADDIVITAAVDETYNRQTSEQTTTFRNRTRDEGAIEQTAAGSSLSGNDIQLQANNRVNVTASTLDADNNLMVGNLEVEQNADGSFSAVNGEGTPDQLVVGSLELTNEDWKHKTEELRGVARLAATAVAHVGGYLSDDFEVTIASSSSEQNTSTTQHGSSLNAGGNMILAAESQVDIIASDITTEGTAILSANNVNVLSAEETQVSETSTSETTVAGTGAYFDKDNAELTVAGLEFTEETVTERQTATTHQGSSISAGNLIMLADENISILASNIDVEGQAVLQAEQDVIVGGHQATVTDEVETQTETTTITAGVRNAYVDAYQATGAYADAYSALEDANSAYKDAQKRYERGELTESALRDYEINLAAAAAGMAQAQLAVGSAAAGAAASAATGGTGFYGSVNAQHSQSSSLDQTTQNHWQGSSINAGSLVVSGENAIFQGSDITAGLASLNSTNTLITAGQGSSTSSSESNSASASANYSTRGPMGGTLGANTSESESTSTWNVNSRFNVGHLESNSDTFTLSGAEVTANTANLDVGHLTIESLQDTHSSSNRSVGGNLGVGNGERILGAGNAGLNSVGVNAGSGASEHQQVGSQTHLIVADGENSQVNADHTTLAGGLIANATRDEDGNLVDHGQLNFSTNTLTVADIDNHSQDQQSGFGMNVGNSSTNVSVQNYGHVTEGMTLATLGQGNVQVNGETLADSDTPNGLNRDLGNAQVTTLDLQTAGLDAGVTVDYRLVSSEGRSEIVAEQLGLAGNTLAAGAGAVADVARVTAAAGSVVELDINQTTNAWNTAGQGQALAYHEGGQLAGLVEGMREGDIEDGFVLQDGLAEVDQFLNQTDDERVRVTEGATNSNGNAVYGAAHQDSNTLFVDIDGERIGSLVNTVAHEGMHLNGAGEINATVTGYMTDLAYRANAYANRDAIDSHRPAPVAIQNPAAHQQLLSGNQALFAELEQRDDLEFRQLNATEIDLVQLNTETYARQQGYCQDTQCSPEALQQAGTELRLEALRRVDATYAEHGEENPNAGEFLNELGAGSAIDGSDQLLFAEDRHYSDSYVSQEHMADAELIAYVLRADDVPEDMKTAVLQSILASTGSGWGQEQLVELFTDSDLKAQVTDTLPLSGFGGQEPLLYSTIVAEAIAGDITRLNDQIAVLQDNLADSNHRGTELGLMEEGQLWNLMAARNMLQQEGGAEPATELMGTMFNHEALGGGSMLLFLGEELADRSRLASLGPQLRGDARPTARAREGDSNNEPDLFSASRDIDLSTLSNKQVGNLGEEISREFLRQNNHTDIITIQNASGNGIDIISRTPDGRLSFFEVKASRTGNVGNLSDRQRNMTEFVEDVLTQAVDGTGRYRSLSTADREFSETALREFRRNPESVSSNLIGVDLQSETLRVSPWSID
ncbi:filamentous hemagglutinin N-terminal domain-containing protein [Natronospirillum operosum]|uniref:Filamentous hemagglutinin N-terminal domain-containing protein n=1 Tax=Natronospirillum operosum TaxID=2759953 RepID=A0A4Z0W7T6_9GAMM|nr:hemagglutinin repeat-containing protein [Natronospirillum operosum]TGG93457.1 filamentous hemagglutinin N-terminal domain-containing protein [Natronospirillum operosum]